MLHAGAAWPVVPDGAILAILGDPIKPAPSDGEMAEAHETEVASL
jgi:hypothetical protein